MKYFMELGCYFDEQLAYEIEKSILNFCAVLRVTYIDFTLFISVVMLETASLSRKLIPEEPTSLTISSSSVLDLIG